MSSQLGSMFAILYWHSFKITVIKLCLALISVAVTNNIRLWPLSVHDSEGQ